MRQIYLWNRPDNTTLDKFQAAQAALHLSYTEHGASASDAPVKDFNNDHQRVPVGHGSTDFAYAKQALQSWVHFPAHWTEIYPNDVPAQTGRDVTLLFSLYGTYWLSGCRTVYVHETPKRYGFAYGTLDSHIERGEELFDVEMDENAVVWYKIRAFSTPRHPLVRLAKPMARLLQEKFRRDSADAVRQFVQSKGTVRSKQVWAPDHWILALLLAIVGMVVAFPGTLLHHDYGQPILIYAALLSSPLVLHLLAVHGWLAERRLVWLLPAGIGLAAAQLIDNQWIASALTVPWLLISMYYLVRQVGSIISTLQEKAIPRWEAVATLAALAFWVVGAAWAFGDPSGIRPWDFSAEITRLTALHFHFAGLALPVLAGLAHHYAASGTTKWLSKAAIVLVVAGVPLTAAGITTTQIGWGHGLESIAGVVMSSAGLLTGLVLIMLGTSGHHAPKVNVAGIEGWLLVAGATLFGTMLLSACYALRSVMPLEFLSINWMRAVHGSLNALVAVPCALIGFMALRFRFAD
jgi:uncharacterized protein (UPF0548 family)